MYIFQVFPYFLSRLTTASLLDQPFPFNFSHVPILTRMSQAGGMSPCTQSIMMGGIMGCGVGGAAGTVLGFAGGLFGGQRRMALVKNTGR